jgi:hypothetical protein
LNKPERGVVDFLAHAEVVGVDDDADFAQDFTLLWETRSSTGLGDDDVASPEKSQWTPGKFLHQV